MTHPYRKRLNIAALLLLTLIIASGCISARTGISWPSASLVGANQNVMVAFNNFMVQIDPADGTEIKLVDSAGAIRVDPDTGEARTWDLAGTSAQSFYTAPVLIGDGSTLLATEYDQKFVKIEYPSARLDAAKSVPMTGQVITDMVFDDVLNRIYVGYNSFNLEAFDADTLGLLWTFKTQSGVWAKPLLHEGVLYFASMDHFLYAVDTAAGELKWKIDLGGASASTPVLFDDTLYVGTFARTVVGVSLDGEQVASYVTANWVWGSPSVDGDTLYAADLSGFVYALNLPDLSEKWAIAAADHGIRPSPLVLDGRIVVVSRTGSLVWIGENDGAIIQTRKVEDEVLSDLLYVPAGERLREALIIVTGTHNNPTLAAFTATDGQRVWEYRR